MSAKPPRLASAVVLYRVRDGRAEVFWIKRSARVSFMAGFHAFPGGTVEKNEAPVEGGPAGEPATAVGAALRELAEETEVKLAPSALTPFGHWITPPFSPIRFDTRFYLAACPPEQEPHVTPGELESGTWIEPQAALEMWEQGKALAAPPIIHLLRAAASSNDPAAWLAPALAIPQAAGADVERIEMRRGVVLVPLRTPTLPPATHTNCYVVGGARPAVVDPGASDPAQQKILESVLAELSREGKKPSRILLTHHHHDHVGGAVPLAKALGVPVCATRATRDAISPGVPVDEIVEDHARFDVGEGHPPLEALVTPGHARGHLCFVTDGALLSGDLILGLGTTVIDPPDGDMGDYMTSLEKLAGMKLGALFPGHGPVLASAMSKIHEYQAHRFERENQILEALSAGKDTPEAIVGAVYTDVPEAMHGLAARSVLAHLEWLASKGAVKKASEGHWKRS